MASPDQQPVLAGESESPTPGASTSHAAARSRGGAHSYQPPPAGNQVDDEERGKPLGRFSLNTIFFLRVIVGSLAIAATIVQVDGRVYCRHATDDFFISVGWFMMIWTGAMLLNTLTRSRPRGCNFRCGKLSISWGPRGDEEASRFMEFLSPQKKSALQLRLSQLFDLIFFILYIVAGCTVCDSWGSGEAVEVLTFIIAGFQFLIVFLTAFRAVTETKLKFIIYAERGGDDTPPLYQIRLPEGKRTEPAVHAV